MDDLVRMGLSKTEDFFDDGDNGTIGRMETGEDPEDYGVREVRTYPRSAHNFTAVSICLFSCFYFQRPLHVVIHLCSC